MTRPAARLTSVLFLFAFMARPESQMLHGDSPVDVQYRALVDAYRGRDTDKPVDGVLALDLGQVRGVVDYYVRLGRRGFPNDPMLDVGFFRAAAMLHAAVSIRCLESFRDELALTHINFARRLIDVSEPPGTKPGSFRHRWYAATALMLTNHLEVNEALEYFEDAIRKLPGDVALLTAAGWFSEKLADGAAAAGSNLKGAQKMRRRHQQDAAQRFRQALEVDRRATEAALRLARMEIALGDLTQARARLSALVSRQDVEPLVAYVGRMLLGDVHDRQGELAEAERLYRAAMTFDRIAQSARVALARLRYASGDAAGAAELIEPPLKPGIERERNDPWAEYRFAYPVIGRMMFDTLRNEVRR